MAYLTASEAVAPLDWFNPAEQETYTLAYIDSTVIPEQSALVDAQLRAAGYTTPIVDTGDLLLIKQVVRGYVAQELKDVSEDNRLEGEEAGYRNGADALMKRILAREVKLSSAPKRRIDVESWQAGRLDTDDLPGGYPL